jgi:hypothetical protein
MEWERGDVLCFVFLMSLCACAIYACLLYTFYYLMMLLRGRGSKGKEDGRVLPYRAAAGILHIMALFFFSFPFIFWLIPAPLCGLYDRSKSLMPWRLDSLYSRVWGNLFSRPFYHAESINDIPPPPANRVTTPFLTQTHKRVDFVNCQAHGKNINSSQKTFENPAIFSKNFGRHSPKKNFLGRGGS